MPAARAPESRLTGLAGTLRCCQLFGGLPAEDLALIAGFVSSVKLAKGQLLFREGEPSRGCYLVQGGAVSVHRVNAAGREQVIHIFRAGESFAEASLASATGYPADARAVAGYVFSRGRMSGFRCGLFHTVADFKDARPLHSLKAQTKELP